MENIVYEWRELFGAEDEVGRLEIQREREVALGDLSRMCGEHWEDSNWPSKVKLNSRDGETVRRLGWLGWSEDGRDDNYQKGIRMPCRV